MFPQAAGHLRTRSAPTTPTGGSASRPRRKLSLGAADLPAPASGLSALSAAASELQDRAVRPAVADSVLLIDWDDTLMSSSWISRLRLPMLEAAHGAAGRLPVGAIAAALIQKPSLLSGEARLECEQLAEAVVEFLTAARRLLAPERIIIVTNSEAGWVQLSASAFLRPALHALAGLRIVSARTAFERFFPNQPSSWKAAAFAYEVQELLKVGAPVRRIVSVGDGVQERHGCAITCAQFGVIGASVRMMHLPTPRLLSHELRAVSKALCALLEGAYRWQEVACVRSWDAQHIDLVPLEQIGAAPPAPQRAPAAAQAQSPAAAPAGKRDRPRPQGAVAGAVAPRVASPHRCCDSPRMGERRRRRKVSSPYNGRGGGANAVVQRSSAAMDMGNARAPSPRSVPGSPLLVA